jgi:hypothetical protein
MEPDMKPDIWVDFNEIAEDGTTTALREFVTSETTLAVGVELVVGDEDRNSCPARVEAFDDEIVTVRLDLSRIHRTRLSDFASGLASCGG